MEDGEKQKRTSMEDCRKRYEEKRKLKQEGRTFRQEWKKAFIWLQFDEHKKCFAVCTENFLP